MKRKAKRGKEKERRRGKGGRRTIRKEEGREGSVGEGKGETGGSWGVEIQS